MESELARSPLHFFTTLPNLCGINILAEVLK